MDDRRRKGDRGESYVATYLKKQGYTVIEQQFRCRRGEIDVIARSPDGIICFVEVKTRKDAVFAEAREFVTPAKQRRIRAAAQYYLIKYGNPDSLCRFDVAEVYLPDGFFKRPKINYLMQAFD